MKYFEHDLENLKEIKKELFNHRITILKDLILQRYQSLVTLSTISFAISGLFIALNKELIKHDTFVNIILFILVTISLVSFSRYLFLIRDDINIIYKKIDNSPKEDLNLTEKEIKFSPDYWPEALFISIIICFILLLVSFLC